MNVLLLTVFVGIVLVAFFVALFLHEVAREHPASERDALLPLAEEKPAFRTSVPVTLEAVGSPRPPLSP